MRRRKLRRKGKAPPGVAVSAQGELRLQLRVIETNFNGRTTTHDYATPSRRSQLSSIAFAPEGAVSPDNREASLHDLKSEFGHS
jgi:hypothetical protein